MGDDVKGYVVRGTWKARTLAGVEHPDRVVYAYWWDLMQDIQWCSEPDKIPFDGRLYFATVGEADAARCKSSHLSDVSIFRVHADGREERLPSYEEALALLGADPLAAIEAAERRLLEAGGWRDRDGDNRWREGTDERWCERESAVRMAAAAYRRRLAAKGGA